MTVPVRIEKLMALTAEEYATTIARLGSPPLLRDGGNYFELDNGSVLVTYTELPRVTLGGLMALPRALVALTFDGANDAARAAFLKRFELTFQRGGG